MKFLKGDHGIFQTIQENHAMKEITHLEFNYPEHIVPYDMEKLVAAVGDMGVNGVATRFKEHFVAGEFTNPSSEIAEDAVSLCKSAADACAKLDGEVLTVWLGFDGFDYPFQLDYEENLS